MEDEEFCKARTSSDGVIWKGDTRDIGDASLQGGDIFFVISCSYVPFPSLVSGSSSDQSPIRNVLKVNDFPTEKKIYVVGGAGILEELELAGFTGLGGPEDAKKTVELKPNCLFEHDRSVMYRTLCLRENPGCIFIATNCDAVGHMTDLQEWPGAGCMVAAICGATEKEPIVVGKPSTFMDFLLKKFHIKTSKMCMVGDRLDTDILFGQNAGCKTLLVLSDIDVYDS